MDAGGTRVGKPERMGIKGMAACRQAAGQYDYLTEFRSWPLQLSLFSY